MKNFDTNREHRIVSWNQAFDSIYEGGGRFEQPTQTVVVEDSVLIFVYDISSTETIVLPEYPAVGYSRNEYPAFIFYDKSILAEAIVTKQFPVPEKFVTVLDRQREKIIDISHNFLYYCDYLVSALSVQRPVQLTKEFLKLVHNKLKKRKKGRDFEDLLFAHSVLIMHLLAEELGGSVVLKQENSGYWPTLVPVIRVGESAIDVIRIWSADMIDKPFDEAYARISDYAEPSLKRAEANKSIDDLADEFRRRFANKRGRR